MTALLVDDKLYELASKVAAAQGKTVEDFACAALRQALSRGDAVRDVRNGLPVMLVGDETPRIDPDRVRRCLEEDGV